MDLKRYKKTRYQNIYKSIKKQNYIVVIPGTHTTIGADEKGNKIFDIEMAQKIRDNKKLRITKKVESVNNGTFKEIWEEYYNDCKKSMSFNTLKRKRLLYTEYFYKLDNFKLSKINKQDILQLIDKIDTTDKQKNRVIIELRAFFSWCIEKEYMLFNPAKLVKKNKVTKSEMKYWLPEHIKAILGVIDNDIVNGTEQEKISAYAIKMVILLGFNLGDRLGETRALRFCDVSGEYNTITIEHSIDYNPKSETHLKDTKNEQSKRIIDVSDKLINEIQKYRDFLTNTLGLDIKDDTIILTNPATNKPYSDTMLRKYFNYYIEKSGVPKIRLYDLRHTFVTTMMTEGWEMYAISKRIGHSNIQTTINTYGHISEEVKKEMAKTTDKYY